MQKHLIPLKAKSNAYVLKMAGLRELRDVVFDDVSLTLRGVANNLARMESNLNKEAGLINGYLSSSHSNLRVELIKPRTAKFGFNSLHLGGKKFEYHDLKRNFKKLVDFIRTDGMCSKEGSFIARVITDFHSTQWLPYQRYVNSIQVLASQYALKKSKIKASEFENERLILLNYLIEAIEQDFSLLKSIDEDFDDIIFKINTIGGDNRGYKSILARWRINGEKIRYPIGIILANPEIAYVAWDRGDKRIVRPVNRIKKYAPLGQINERLIRHLRQRRFKKPLMEAGVVFRRLTKHRLPIMNRLDHVITILLGEKYRQEYNKIINEEYLNDTEA